MIVTYLSRAGGKLRCDRLAANMLIVFVMTDRFKPKEPQYQNALTVNLPTGSMTVKRFALPLRE